MSVTVNLLNCCSRWLMSISMTISITLPSGDAPDISSR